MATKKQALIDQTQGIRDREIELFLKTQAVDSTVAAGHLARAIDESIQLASLKEAK